MSLLEILKARRCPLCFRRERPLEDMRAMLNDQHVELKEKSWALDQERKAIMDRETVYMKRQDSLDEFKSHLLEKDMLLSKREADFIKEKEQMLGKDNLEIKSQILLPFLKQKWEAEAKKLDAERICILQNTPVVNDTLLSRKLELESRQETIRKKPSTTGNHDLLLEVQSRLKELGEITAIIDKARTPA